MADKFQIFTIYNYMATKDENDRVHSAHTMICFEINLFRISTRRLLLDNFVLLLVGLTVVYSLQL